ASDGCLDLTVRGAWTAVGAITDGEHIHQNERAECDEELHLNLFPGSPVWITLYCNVRKLGGKLTLVKAQGELVAAHSDGPRSRLRIHRRRPVDRLHQHAQRSIRGAGSRARP